MLTEKEKDELLKIARQTLTSYINDKQLPQIPQIDTICENLKKESGAFVTLHRFGTLRGCIGLLKAQGPLYLTIQKMTIAASVEDPRFNSVQPNELSEIDIEISVLSPLKKVVHIQDIEVGVHGLMITKPPYRGVLLPQVATANNWNREEFLSQTCVKAGLNPEAWKDKNTLIESFSAQVFGEKDS